MSNLNQANHINTANQATANLETANAEVNSASSPRRMIRIKQVQALTGLSRSAIYDRINPKSKRYDPAFPKGIKLYASTQSSGAVGWNEQAIQAWIEQRIHACLDA